MSARRAAVAIVVMSLAAAPGVGCDGEHGAPTASEQSAGGASSAGGAGGDGGAGGGAVTRPAGAKCTRDGPPCVDGTFCSRFDFDCESEGVCRPTPTCAAGGEATCGCDGVVYPSSCAAHAAGTNKAMAVHCPPPPGHFACEASYCDVATEFCHDNVGPTTCEPFPTACAPVATCDCLMSAISCDGDVHGCSAAPDGGITLACQNFH